MRYSSRFSIGIALLVGAVVAPLQPTHAAEAESQVRLKAGEMGMVTFLEMASEKLDMNISVSASDTAVLPTITVPEMGALSLDRARALVLTSLYQAGYTWIQDTAAGLHRVVRLRDARDQEVPVVSDSEKLPDSDQLVTYIMQIRHTPPDVIARNLRSFMPSNSRVIPDASTSSILITDSAFNVLKLKKLAERMDTPQAAKDANVWLAEKAREADCPSTGAEVSHPRLPVLIALFSLIALVIGFLARGYVIRRIEGGL